MLERPVDMLGGVIAGHASGHGRRELGPGPRPVQQLQEAAAGCVGDPHQLMVEGAELARGIAADLVAKPVDADELDRALTPLKQQLMRMSSGNMFWMRLVDGGTTDPARIAAVETLAKDFALTTPAEIQALAIKYLRPERDWTFKVVPVATK